MYLYENVTVTSPVTLAASPLGLRNPNTKESALDGTAMVCVPPETVIPVLPCKTFAHTFPDVGDVTVKYSHGTVAC